MYRQIRLLTLVFFLILSMTPVLGQSDTLTNANDSLNESIVKGFSRKIAEIELLRSQDSIKMASLNERLQSLNTSDNLEKEKLLFQLNKLKSRDSLRLLERRLKIDSLKITALAYPVMGFFGDTLMLLYNGIGSLSAKERADLIHQHITSILPDFISDEDTVIIRDTESGTNILFRNKVIMSVLEIDALWNNSNTSELAALYAARINKAIKYYKKETGFGNLLKNIAIAILIALISIGLIYFIRRWYGNLVIQVRLQKGVRFKGFKFRNSTILDPTSQVNLIISVLDLLKWFITILIIYIALPLLFGLFPWTKDLAQLLFGYILNPIKKIGIAFWNYLPNLFTVLIIIVVFRYIFNALRFFKAQLERGTLHIKGFYSDWANPTYQIIRVLVFAFMVTVIFPYLPGSNSPVFQGVSVFLGFLFTFGSAGSLSNVVAGLVLTYMRLFKLGDRVKIGEVIGDVVEKTLLVTRIRTIKNEIISIPNSSVMTSHTTNYSAEAATSGLIVHSTVTIGYDVPWKEVHEALIEAALKTGDVLAEPEPFVMQTSLDDFYVSYQINAFTRMASKQAVIYSDLHQNIQDSFNQRNIEIMSPHYSSWRDGNETTVPKTRKKKNTNT
ncbi:MAG: mechanosensitive ion channel family protein [Flavobacteriales bacterium]|nr:mechanosensitive ion channel family protein [Flavobacteriales bacterium]